MQNTIIGLVDANNFYAATHKIFEAQLTKKPVLVLTNNDGLVIARSKESRALGIEMGVSLFEIRHLIEKHDIKVISSNYELYSNVSWRFQGVIEEFTPDIEHYSIDEVFLRLPHCYRESPAAIGREMRFRVEALTGVPVSVGFARTKTLAKIAIEHAKKSERAHGVVDLTEPTYHEAALTRIPIGDVWRVGPRYAALLERNGIRTALDLRDADDNWVKKMMTIVGLRTVHELRGIECFPLEPTPKIKQMIGVSRSFGAATDDYREIKAAVAFFISRAAEKLRKNGLVAGLLTVFMLTDRFKDTPQYAGSTTLNVGPKSDSTIELLTLALRGLNGIYRAGFQIRKAGVLLDALELAERVSQRLWDRDSYESHQRLMAAVDDLNDRHGHETVRCGLFPSSGIWRTRFEHLSPNYTTRWTDLMTAQ